jgi:uncharacterized protein (DUF736 family)
MNGRSAVSPKAHAVPNQGVWMPMGLDDRVICRGIDMTIGIAMRDPAGLKELAHGVLNAACLTEGRLRCTPSRSHTRNGRSRFLPLPAAPPFLAKHESLAWPPFTAFRPFRCGSIASGLSPSHRGRDGRPRQTERNTTMATIGTFISNGNGFAGTVKTLALNVKAKLVPAERTSGKGPDFRVLAGNVEFGAAWKKTSERDRDYLSVKLDDPSFPAPIYATLIEVEGEQGLSLIWSRPNRD